MKKYLNIVIVFFVCSCNKDINNIEHLLDNTGVVIATPYLWKTSLHNGIPIENSFIFYPIIYKNSIVIPTTSNGSRRNLSALDVKNGKTLWCWDDSFENGNRFLYLFDHAIHKNHLIIQPGSSYCINLDDGSTYWKYVRDRSLRTEVALMGDKYFNFGPIYSDEGTEMAAYIGDVESGEIEPKIRVTFPDDIDYPDGHWGPKFKGGVLFINNMPDNERMLVVSHHEVLSDWTFNTYFSLYNADSEEWIWQKELIFANHFETFFSKPCIYNGKIYANVGRSIVCHELITGKQLWKRDFNNDFMFSGFIIEDGRLIANNEDCFTCCLDPETGEIQWKVNTAGSCGRMSYLNGIVYFAGCSLPRLFAIEASTGKILWKINTVLLGEPHGTQFKYNAVYTIPASGGQPAKVIALSDMYAYCFEAYK